uniref:Valine--tRNA ligase, mitochondrial n=1 Tax=Amphiprion ocellaris TaxID=80972 RepID=A0AAQ5Y1C5_AMPOC
MSGTRLCHSITVVSVFCFQHCALFRMWRAVRFPSLWLPGRKAVRLSSSNPPKPSHPFPSPSNSSPRPQAEKQRRRRAREEAIMSSQHSFLFFCADTSLPFPSSYSPEYVESSWYQWWEKKGFFSPERHQLSHSVDQTFSLCIPPPNVTGSLHLGHALTVAIQDALVRWRRMQGYRVLWVPGCDHAGIATQTVVERRLLREEGKCRQDFTRDGFIQEVWKWKNEKGDEIYHQLRMLGASLDWSRACFTMDPSYSRAVTAAFVRLCDSGLIYRSEGLVNWSCALESAISDIEVDSKELSGQTMLFVPGYENKVEFGTMYTFAYPLEGHGKHLRLSRNLIHVVLRVVLSVYHPHSLQRVTVIGGDGTMMPCCGQWLERFDARQLVVDALVEKKLFRGKKTHAMTLPICSRSGDIVEPLLKKQWFVRCNEMANKAIQAVEDGQLEIIPHYYTKTWKNWLSNISDWCVSRQLWWGHQIPAYQVELPNSTDKQEELWVWGQSEDEARQRAAVKYGVKPEAFTLTQDPDVLDTWFSSGLFPFAMLGWPEQTSDLQDFYPNSILETGSDLIFFWVARMVMLGTELTGQLPFKQVIFHSLIRDKYGRKMSKSLGNVIDPLDVIHGVSLEVGTTQTWLKEGNLEPREQLVAMEAQTKDFPNGIPQCGTDALRFALCSHKIQGEDISLSIPQVLGSRHFCNKMWQTLRFTLGVLGDNTAPCFPLSSMDRWICSRLHSTVVQCEHAFKAYELHTVTSTLYSFWVHSLCDVYMEHIKSVLGQQDPGTVIQSDKQDSGSARQMASTVLYHCVSMSLALLSPFMPFITEELWQRLQPFRSGSTDQASLCLQPYPHSSQLVGLASVFVAQSSLLSRCKPKYL